MEKFKDFSKLIKKVGATLKKLEVAHASLDPREFMNLKDNLSQTFSHLDSWENLAEELDTSYKNIQEELSHPEYPTILESKLREQSIPLSGAFPSYEIPPFKLSVNLDNFTARLSLGRKSQHTGKLSVSTLSAWVARKYKALTDSPFNQERLCRELTDAYRILTDSKWGLPILVKDVYKLLTIKAEAKLEYPEQRFIYDLGRLLDQFQIKNNEFVFEFSSHNKSTNNYTIVNQAGREKAIGTMIIRKID